LILSLAGSEMGIAGRTTGTMEVTQSVQRWVLNRHHLKYMFLQVTQGFLEYTKGQGNDLSTPRGGFPGLKPGDMWCLCAARWRQAMLAGSAPRVVAAATHQASLQVNSVEEMTRQDDSCPGSA